MIIREAFTPCAYVSDIFLGTRADDFGMSHGIKREDERLVPMRVLSHAWGMGKMIQLLELVLCGGIVLVSKPQSCTRHVVVHMSCYTHLQQKLLNFSHAHSRSRSNPPPFSNPNPASPIYS
jgi:hypothetical protein